MFEDGVPPRFRLRAINGSASTAQASSIETVRPDGRDSFSPWATKAASWSRVTHAVADANRIDAFDRRPAVNRPGVPTPIGELSYCRAVQG